MRYLNETVEEPDQARISTSGLNADDEEDNDDAEAAEYARNLLSAPFEDEEFDEGNGEF